MKNFYFGLVLLILVSLFTACSCTSSNNGYNSQTDISEQTTFDDVISSYKPPAEIIDVDLNSEDPSNNKIKFEYDSQGRISKCYYKINNNDIYQSYTYTNDTIHIYAFCGSTLIDDISFDNASYSENLGFSEYHGYYFSNVSFDSQTYKDANQTSIITEEEAVALVREKVGDGFGLLSEGIVEREGNEYYAVRVTQLVNEGHSSTLTHYFVRTDGLEIFEGSM